MYVMCIYMYVCLYVCARKKNREDRVTQKTKRYENTFNRGDNNYLLNGEKVKLFSRDKTRDILLFERSENNNSSRVLSSEKTLFRHLIRNFIFCTSLFAHKHLTKKDYFVKGMHPVMQVALKSLPTFSTKSLTTLLRKP